MLVELKQRLREISDLNAAGHVLTWDQATYMPEGGAGWTWVSSGFSRLTKSAIDFASGTSQCSLRSAAIEGGLLSPQLQTFGCVALSDVKSQKSTSSSQVGVADYEPPTVKLNLPSVL
jgi:hypothetical protein